MLTQAEREQWAAKIRARYEEQGGISDEWIITSTTSTTGSRTPTGLLSPPPSKNLIPRQEPLAAPVTTVGFPSAVELCARLKRLEDEQRRAGTEFRLHFDTEDWKWRVVPDNGDGSADPDASSMANSPLHDEQQRDLESTASSHSQESCPPSPTASAPKPRGTKRQRDSESSSSMGKKRKTSIQDINQGPRVPDTDHDTAQAASKPVNQPSGRLARDIGQAVRRKSKKFGQDRKKRGVIQQGKTGLSHQETDLESKEKKRVSRRDNGKNKANEAYEEDELASLQQVGEASTAIDHDSSSETSQRRRVGPTRTHSKQATNQKLYSPYARTGRSTARSANKELPREASSGFDREPNAPSSTVRTRKKTLKQQQLDDVEQGRSAPPPSTSAPLRNTSSNPRTNKKIQKKTGSATARGSSARITRSQTSRSFPFVELDEHGEEIRTLGPNFNNKQRNALKLQRVQERKKKKYWKRAHQDAVERYNMQQVWREWFAEQGAEYEDN